MPICHTITYVFFENLSVTYDIATKNPAATQDVAARLGASLRGGEVIELTSDLGGGKTTFVQGLARGLGYHADVTSPTFVLSRVYEISPELEVHHYDLYRLGVSGVLGEQLAEDMKDPHVITVIEWAGIVENELPDDRLTLELKVTGDDKRDLKFTSGGPVSDRLLKKLKP
jgi:tRNA threonylcarbamoyladenosine biosynthesis protein TsaE